MSSATSIQVCITALRLTRDRLSYPFRHLNRSRQYKIVSPAILNSLVSAGIELDDNVPSNKPNSQTNDQTTGLYKTEFFKKLFLIRVVSTRIFAFSVSLIAKKRSNRLVPEGILDPGSRILPGWSEFWRNLRNSGQGISDSWVGWRILEDPGFQDPRFSDSWGPRIPRSPDLGILGSRNLGIWDSWDPGFSRIGSRILLEELFWPTPRKAPPGESWTRPAWKMDSTGLRKSIWGLPGGPKSLPDQNSGQIPGLGANLDPWRRKRGWKQRKVVDLGPVLARFLEKTRISRNLLSRDQNSGLRPEFWSLEG